MKFKDLFKRKGKKGIAETTIVDTEMLDIPKVVFEDIELQVTIGQWLGELSYQQGFGNANFTFYTPLTAEELMKGTNISAKNLENITKKFGKLLKIVGVDSSETCVLNQYDKEKFSFNCYFNNVGDNANIFMEWGSMDDMPELTIDYHSNSKTFNFTEAHKNIPMRLNLAQYTITNSENGNEVWRYLSRYSSPITLSNGDYKLTTDIDRPKSIEPVLMGEYNYVYKLRNEEELEQYLLGLSFPIDIVEVYEKIRELSLDDVSKYPKLSLKIEKIINDKSSETTDLISMNNGQLTNLIKTRNGITISVDSQENWSYKTSELSVSQNNEGKVNFSLHFIPKDMLDGVIKPSEQVNIIHQEVEQVRILAKRLSN